MKGLTPELSRPASGEAGWYKTPAQAEAAKRVRLERIVRHFAAILNRHDETYHQLLRVGEGVRPPKVFRSRL